MTKTVPFPGFPLLVMFALVAGLQPCSAQTLVSGLAPDDLRPGTEVTQSEVTLDHESSQSADGFSNDQRLDWFVQNTVGPRSLVAGAAGAALGTGLNGAPRKGGLGQDFTRRYEMHLADTATANAIEATLGAIWREDPRYYRVPTMPFGSRVRNVIRMTFEAYHGRGNLTPAYARYIAIAGSSFLVNSRPSNSEAALQDAALCTLAGFLGRIGSNAFQEFWPNIKPRLFHHRPSSPRTVTP